MYIFIEMGMRRILFTVFTSLLFNHTFSQQLAAFSTLEGPTVRVDWASTSLMSNGNMAVTGTTRDELHHVYNGVSTQYHYNSQFTPSNGFFAILNPDKDLLFYRNWYPQNPDTGHMGFGPSKVDQQDNVYITGHTQGRMDINPIPIGSGGPFIGSTTNSRPQSFILKLDSAGNYLWHKELELTSPDPANNSIFGLCIEPNGDITVAGAFFKSTDFDPGPGTQIRTSDDEVQSFLLRLDSSGNFISVKVLDQFNGRNIFWQMEPGSSGGYFIRGTFQDTVDLDLNGNNPAILIAHPGSNLYSDDFIARYDSNDNLIWSYHTPPGRQSFEIEPDDEDNLYFSGYGYPGAILSNGDSVSSALTNPQLVLEKLDPNGGYQWHTMIKGPEYESVYDIATEEDSVYLMFGFEDRFSTQSLTNDTTIFNLYGEDALGLSVFDYQGQHLQTLTLQSPFYIERGWNMIVTGNRIDFNVDIHGPTDLDPGPADATYSLVSYFEGVAMLAWGLDLPFVPNSLTPTETFDWAVYPNPSSGIFEVRFPNPGPEGEIKVFDLAGRQVLDHTFRGFGTQVDLSGTPQGMYLLQVQVGERTAVKRILKK